MECFFTTKMWIFCTWTCFQFFLTTPWNGHSRQTFTCTSTDTNNHVSESSELWKQHLRKSWIYLNIFFCDVCEKSFAYAHRSLSFGNTRCTPVRDVTYGKHGLVVLYFVLQPLLLCSFSSHIYKLIDFGAATELVDDRENGFHSLWGTEEYMVRTRLWKYIFIIYYLYYLYSTFNLKKKQFKTISYAPDDLPQPVHHVQSTSMMMSTSEDDAVVDHNVPFHRKKIQHCPHRQTVSPTDWCLWFTKGLISSSCLLRPKFIT